MYTGDLHDKYSVLIIVKNVMFCVNPLHINLFVSHQELLLKPGHSQKYSVKLYQEDIQDNCSIFFFFFLEDDSIL